MPQFWPFKGWTRNLSDPAYRHTLIVPSDTEDLPIRPRVLYCVGSGTARIQDEDGTVFDYTLVAGQPFAFSPVRVHYTGTTATLVGWW